MTDELKQRQYDGMAKLTPNVDVAARFLGSPQSFLFKEGYVKDLCTGVVGEDGVFRVYTPSGKFFPCVISTCFWQDVDDSRYGIANGFLCVLAGDGTPDRPINYEIDSRSCISLYGEALPCSSLLDSTNLVTGGYLYSFELTIRYAHTAPHKQAPTMEPATKAVDNGQGQGQPRRL